MLKIRIVGGGCTNCEKLASLCYEIVSENNLDAEITKVTDLNDFADLGIFVTPGLIVNNKILSQGKLPTRSTLDNWLNKLVIEKS